MATMTKADLVDEVAKLSNLTKKETELIVNTVFDSISLALCPRREGRAAGVRELPRPSPQFPPRPQSEDGLDRQRAREARAVLQGRQAPEGAGQRVKAQPRSRPGRSRRAVRSRRALTSSLAAS